MDFFLVPFDGGNLKVKGSSEAPEVVSSFMGFKAKKIQIDNFNIDFTMENISKEIKNSVIEKNKLCIIGGDHSITYGAISGVFEGLKLDSSELFVLYFDAHLDAEDNFIPPSHEDVIQAVSKLVKPANILIIGARKYWDKEIEFVKQNKIKVIYRKEFDDLDSVKKKFQNFLKNVINKNGKLYLSFDIDFYDEKIAYATGYPEKDGLDFNVLKELFDSIDISKNLIAFDFVEYIPKADKNKEVLKLIKKTIEFFISLF